MLVKKNKYPLRKDKEFFSQAKRIDSPLFTIWFKTSNKQFQSMVLVGKKVSKSAVVRNGIKRKMYKALSNEVGESPKLIVVFGVKKSILKADDNQVILEIQKSLQKCKKLLFS